jgi:hypothetical protein
VPSLRRAGAAISEALATPTARDIECSKCVSWFRSCLVQLFSDQLFWKSGCKKNLAVRRIWVLCELRAEEDEVVQSVQDLESNRFLLSWRFDRFCVHVDFGRFLPKHSYRSWLKSWGVWRSAAAFGGQKLKKDQTNRGLDYRLIPNFSFYIIFCVTTPTFHSLHFYLSRWFHLYSPPILHYIYKILLSNSIHHLLHFVSPIKKLKYIWTVKEDPTRSRYIWRLHVHFRLREGLSGGYIASVGAIHARGGVAARRALWTALDYQSHRGSWWLVNRSANTQQQIKRQILATSCGSAHASCTDRLS